MDTNVIYLVSGLPRSGTSMMMKMLEAGGLTVLTDNIRIADEDNPKGYYEFERVKQIKEDHTWMEEAKGKVVKMISMLLLNLPATHKYKIVFMRRKMEEILASQKQMLVRNDKATNSVSDEKMADLFDKHLKQVMSWLEQQPHIETIYINYNEMLEDPLKNISILNTFFGNTLNTNEMTKIVDGALYRQRR